MPRDDPTHDGEQQPPARIELGYEHDAGGYVLRERCSQDPHHRVPPEQLGLSDDLLSRLQQWGARYARTWRAGGTGFEDPQELQRWSHDGLLLAQDLQAELGRDVEVLHAGRDVRRWGRSRRA